MTHRQTAPLDANDNVTLATLLKALADGVKVGKTSDFHPTDGRLLEDSEDGTIYVGNGSSWINADDTVGLDTPATTTVQRAHSRHRRERGCER